jgi:hypothetical protein
VSCNNYATPTQVRIQAQTGEGKDATFTKRSQDKTAANYSAKMRTIKGGYNGAGTKITVYVSRNGTLAGGRQNSLLTSPSRVWTLNLYHCAAGKCD